MIKMEQDKYAGDREKIEKLKKRLEMVVTSTAISENMTCGEVITSLLEVTEEEKDNKGTTAN